MISDTAWRVLLELWDKGRHYEERARTRQVKAALRGASLYDLAMIYRREMAYTPADKLRELNSVRPL